MTNLITRTRLIRGFGAIFYSHILLNLKIFMLPTNFRSVSQQDFRRDIQNTSVDAEIVIGPTADTKNTSISFDLFGLFDQLQEVNGENLVESFVVRNDDDVNAAGRPSTFPELFEFLFKDELIISRARHQQRKILIARIFTELSTVSHSELSEILAQGEESRLRSMLLTCMRFVVGLKDNGDEAIHAKQLVADFSITQSDAINTEIFGKGPIHLVNIDLRNIHFFGINGESANFSGSNLEDATFEKSNLNFAKFYQADLTGVSFIDTSVQFAHFNGSNLNLARFINIQLLRTDFIGSILIDADFSGANISHVDCTNSDLRGAKFCGATIKWLNLSAADVRVTDFQTATVKHNSWSGINFSGSNFNGTNLDQPTLLGANFYMADLSETGLNRDSMRGAIWEENDLSDLGFAQGDQQTIPALEFQPDDIERPVSQLTRPVGENADLATHQSSLPIQQQGTDVQVRTNSVVIRQGSNQPEPERLPKPALTSLRPIQPAGPTKITSHHVIRHQNVHPKVPQVLPSARTSVWGWLFNVSEKIGDFFKDIYLRFWR